MSDLCYSLAIDTDAGTKRFGGKRDRYMKSLRIFAAGLPGERIDPESPDLAREVHAIKGVAGNLGITSLYDYAVKYEIAIKAGTASKEDYDKFYEVCAASGMAIIEQFDDSAQAAPDAGLPAGDSVTFNALLSMLRVALYEGDIMTAEEITSELKTKSWPNAANVSLVCKHIEAYDFDAALKLLPES